MAYDIMSPVQTTNQDLITTALEIITILHKQYEKKFEQLIYLLTNRLMLDDKQEECSNNVIRIEADHLLASDELLRLGVQSIDMYDIRH